MSDVPNMIAVDFDGTVCDFKFPATGELKKGVREALALFRQLGYHVIIYSCRSCTWFPDNFAQMPGGEFGPVEERQVYKDMKAFLDANEVPYDSIDDGKKGKPYATFYIDDKGIHFQDNWDEIARAIEMVTLSDGVRLDAPTRVQVPAWDGRGLEWIANR